MRADLLLTFAAAWGALVVLPGPDTALVVARTVASGRRAGAVAAAGSLTALAAHVTLAALGLSAIVAQSATAFTVIKLVGAAYLVVLGVRLLRTRSVTDEGIRVPLRVPGFRGAVLTGLLNPKSAIFFLTFLPQFVDRDLAAAPQFALLGLITVVLAGLWHLLLIALTGRVRRVVARPWFEKATGGAFVALGAKLATG